MHESDRMEQDRDVEAAKILAEDATNYNDRDPMRIYPCAETVEDGRVEPTTECDLDSGGSERLRKAQGQMTMRSLKWSRKPPSFFFFSTRTQHHKFEDMQPRTSAMASERERVSLLRKGRKVPP